MSYNLIKYPDKLLYEISQPVAELYFGGERAEALNDIKNEMIEAMEENNGLGLAAVQVGYLLRMMVMKVRTEIHADGYQVLINPQIVGAFGNSVKGIEGCLSFRGVYANVMRREEVEVEFRTQSGGTVKAIFCGLESACIQHEIDHFDGKTFISRLSDLERLKVQPLLNKLKHM